MRDSGGVIRPWPVEPNDLAGKRRGFRSRSTLGNRNKTGIKPIGLDKYRLNTPLPGPSGDFVKKSRTRCLEHWYFEI
jgi:hypothetical protein